MIENGDKKWELRGRVFEFKIFISPSGQKPFTINNYLIYRAIKAKWHNFLVSHYKIHLKRSKAKLKLFTYNPYNISIVKMVNNIELGVLCQNFNIISV